MKPPILPERVSHYCILNKLGSGGMAEVYLAEDTTLHRKVAIKFLPAESTADQQAKKRLIREAQAAATLDHPNICSIHEVSEEAGRSFIVMQYVEGETLAGRIRSKSLDLSECLEIAAQVADALAEAHSHGIIHRDIKPQNIMITAHGQAKVMDFGLAKVSKAELISDSEGVTQSLLTEPGMLVGTPQYMSPEQVKGQTLDARSDIFSFGVVLYEMMSGHHPFAAETPAATISDILTREPRPLARYSRGVPTELERIASKALRKDREERYQAIKDLALDLKSLKKDLEFEVKLERSLSPDLGATADTDRRLRSRTRKGLPALIALGLVVSAVAGWLIYALLFRGAPRADQARINSLAVLPLENLSGDPAQEYFADGMTESLITELARIAALRVISRTSVMQYKGVRRPIGEITKALNVDAVVEGSVQRVGGRVKITAQLIRGATDQHLWAESYDRDLSDALSLQRDVARAIADEIKVRVTPQERANMARSTRRLEPEVYQLYLQARYQWSERTLDGFERSIELYKRALARDPEFALAYAGLAESYAIIPFYSPRPSREYAPEARANAIRALELDSGLGEAHAALGFIRLYYDWDWAGSEQELKRAIELSPSFVTGHHWYAEYLTYVGQHDDALAQIRTALDLDPFSPLIRHMEAWVLYYARRYDKAIEVFSKVPNNEQFYSGNHRLLGYCYEASGRLMEARAEYEKADKLRGVVWSPDLARLDAPTGRRQEALKVLSELTRLWEKGQGRAMDIAVVQVALANREQAFQWVERAYQARDVRILELTRDPRLDPLRSDPRFQDLLRRLNRP